MSDSLPSIGLDATDLEEASALVKALASDGGETGI